MRFCRAESWLSEKGAVKEERRGSYERIICKRMYQGSFQDQGAVRGIHTGKLDEPEYKYEGTGVI